MKKFILLFTLTFFAGVIQGFSQSGDQLVDICFNSAGKDVTYLKDFVVKLPQSTDKQHQPIAKNSVLLRKNTTYRFTVCNAEKSEGKGILQLFDTNRLLASNFNPKSGKLYQSFNFKCNKTGLYSIFILFKDGKSGSAVGIMSYVNK